MLLVLIDYHFQRVDNLGVAGRLFLQLGFDIAWHQVAQGSKGDKERREDNHHYDKDAYIGEKIGPRQLHGEFFLQRICIHHH